MMTLVPFSTDLLKLNPGPEPGPMGNLAPCTHQTFNHWPVQILPPQIYTQAGQGGLAATLGAQTAAPIATYSKDFFGKEMDTIEISAVHSLMELTAHVCCSAKWTHD